MFDLASVELPSQFRLGGDAIVFQYQVYEIAPYVSGPIAVSLTKAELADCLR
ncbi:MAG: RsiV family protein [Bacteroidales bacterium]|nr:RsiV family protein [Bacteroidales bacterium]